MKCLVCSQGKARPGKTTVVLQRNGATVVINDVPARVCENCGEEYVDEQVADSVLTAATHPPAPASGLRFATASPHMSLAAAH